MKKRSSREITLIVVAIIFVLFFICFQWLKKADFNNQRGELAVAEHQDMLKEYYKRYHELAHIEQEDQYLYDQFKMNDSVQQTSSRLVAEIQKHAQNYEVQILNLKPQSVKRSDEIILFPVQMSIVGEWEAIIQWIDTLQSDPLHISLKQIRIEKSSNKDIDLKGRIQIEYFRLL